MVDMINNLVVDLHTHSNYSDGVLSPGEVVERAKERGVEIMSLNDHSTIYGISEAVLEGKRLGVEVIPGVELKFNGGEVLGYYVDVKNEVLNNFLRGVSETSVVRAEYIAGALSSNGYLVSVKELNGEFPNAQGNLNMMHFCYHFYNAGRFDSMRETWKGLGIGLIYRNLKRPSVYDCIRVIRDAGGVAVLAHPWVSETSRKLLTEEKMKGLVDAGLGGIEIDQGDRRVERGEELIASIRHLAERYGLILTSGSDFHGDFLIDSNENPRSHEIGSHNCSYDLLERLKEKRNKFQQETLR